VNNENQLLIKNYELLIEPKNGSCHFAVDARHTVFSYSTYAGNRATPQMR